MSNTIRDILSIDPGSTKSGYVHVRINRKKIDIIEKGIIENHILEHRLLLMDFSIDYLAIEMVGCYGQITGMSIFETAVWIGRFYTACCLDKQNKVRVKRQEIKYHLTDLTRTKDKDVISALVDRFTPLQRNYGKGTKKQPGYFYQFVDDVWQAFALAVYVVDCINYPQRYELKIIHFEEAEGFIHQLQAA